MSNQTEMIIEYSNLIAFLGQLKEYRNNESEIKRRVD